MHASLNLNRHRSSWDTLCSRVFHSENIPLKRAHWLWYIIIMINIIITFIVTCGLFLITTIIGYVRFGSYESSNLLDELSNSRYLNVDIMLVTLQICLSTAVSTTALFQHIEHFFEIPRGTYYESNLFHCPKKKFSSALCGAEKMFGHFVLKQYSFTQMS